MQGEHQETLEETSTPSMSHPNPLITVKGSNSSPKLPNPNYSSLTSPKTIIPSHVVSIIKHNIIRLFCN